MFAPQHSRVWGPGGALTQLPTMRRRRVARMALRVCAGKLWSRGQSSLGAEAGLVMRVARAERNRRGGLLGRDFAQGTRVPMASQRGSLERRISYQLF